MTNFSDEEKNRLFETLGELKAFVVETRSSLNMGTNRFIDHDTRLRDLENKNVKQEDFKEVKKKLFKIERESVTWRGLLMLWGPITGIIGFLSYFFGIKK